MKMDENKNQQSPGMTDNQSGQSRNMYAMPEAEEVRTRNAPFQPSGPQMVPWLILRRKNFNVWTFLTFHDSSSRLDNFSSNPSPSATSFQQLPQDECPPGSGPAVPISKMSVQFSSKHHFTSIRHRFTRRTTTSTTRSSHRKSNILSTQTQPLTFFAMSLKATMSCRGSQWTQILTIGFLVYQFMFKCWCNYITYILL